MLAALEAGLSTSGVIDLLRARPSGIASGALLPIVDLRSPDEFVRGHLAGSTSIPFDELFARDYELPPKVR